MSVLVVDVGTSGVRAAIVRPDATVQHVHYREVLPSTPAPGFVEFDAAAMAAAALDVAGAALAAGGPVEAVGIANQRSSTIVWDRATGEPVGPGVGWQDLRTVGMCLALQQQGVRVAPNVSATKLAFLLDMADPDRTRELCFGTVDAWIAWTLSDRSLHVTDASNAAVTGMLRSDASGWSEPTLDALRVPVGVLPALVDSSGVVGEATALPGSPPIAGIAGDQQAALIGQACFKPGMAKSTYGTGCFLLLNTADTAVDSANRMLTTAAYRIGGRMAYAMEGSIFVAGAAVKWLRDGLRVIDSAAATAALAARVPDDHGVFLVPAFVGLGAPYWEPNARGLICGLTLDASPAHLARAALESVAFQTLDLTDAMARDGARRAEAIRVDGGMAANDWFCQFLADMLEARVQRPVELETTALGAAFLAGLAAGVWKDLESIAATWNKAAEFAPSMPAARRAGLIAGWRQAIERTLLGAAVRP